jgi:methyl-accepting chemotaxis protein
VDDEGKVLAHPGMNASGDARWNENYKADDLLKTGNPEFTSIIQDMIMGGTRLGSYSTDDGEKKMIAYAPIPSIKASLGIVLDSNEVMKPIARIKKIIIGILALVFFVSIGVGIFFSTTITRPIKHLTEISDLISKGKMDLEPLPEDRKDEIGMLIRSINRLIISLKLAINYRNRQ